MAYKFQIGSAILSGSLTQEGTVEIQNDAGAVVGIFDNTGVLSGALGASAASFTADGALEGGSLVVGAANLDATDLLKLDAITNGAGAANKALVLNASSVIASGLVGLTASSGIKAGELEATGHVLAPALISTTTIQGAAISGSGQASFKTLIVDETIAAETSITAGTSFIIGSADLNETDLEKLDGITNGAGAANKALVLDGNSAIVSGLIQLTASAGIKAEKLESTAGAVVGATLSAVDVSASVDLNGNRLAIGGPNYAGATAKISDAGVADFAGSVTAGTSFIIGSADLNEADMEKLDGITNGTGAANKALVLNAASSIASGLASITASADVKAARLESTAKVVVGSDLEVGALFKMPTVTSGHVLVADGTSFQEVAVSGDVTIASNGAVTIADDSIESGMLNDNVISGQTELAADGLNAADELLISDGGTVKKIGVDNLFTDGPGLLTAASVAVADDHFMFLDGGATGDAKTESIVDFVAAIAGSGLGSSNGQLSVQGNTVTVGTDTVILSEGYNYFTGSETAVCTLPSGSVGDVVTVKAGPTGIGKTITVSRSGSQDTIDGATSVVLESPYAAITMVYMTHGDWRII